MSLMGVDPGRFTGVAVLDRGRLVGLDFLVMDETRDAFNRARLTLNRWGPLDAVAIERPFATPISRQSIVAQTVVFAFLKAILFDTFGLWPTEVSPSQTKKGLTGSGNAGAGRRKGIQKSLIILAAIRFPGFVLTFEEMAMRRKFSLSMTNKAREACADALGVALFAESIDRPDVTR